MVWKKNECHACSDDLQGNKFQSWAKKQISIFTKLRVDMQTG